MEQGKQRGRMWPESPFKKQVFTKGVIYSEKTNSHSSHSPAGNGCNSQDILHICPISHVITEHVKGPVRNGKGLHKYAKAPKIILDNTWDEETRSYAEYCRIDGRDNDQQHSSEQGSEKEKTQLEAEPEDPWGSNSPMRRIEILEASYNEDVEEENNESNLNSDQELENEIIREMENHLKQSEQEDTAISSDVISNQYIQENNASVPINVETPSITTEPIFSDIDAKIVENNHEENVLVSLPNSYAETPITDLTETIEMSIEPSITQEQNLFEAVNENDIDSTLGVSIGHPSTEHHCKGANIILQQTMKHLIM